MTSPDFLDMRRINRRVLTEFFRTAEFMLPNFEIVPDFIMKPFVPVDEASED